jgi:hypothetical protein
LYGQSPRNLVAKQLGALKFWSLSFQIVKRVAVFAKKQASRSTVLFAAMTCSHAIGPRGNVSLALTLLPAEAKILQSLRVAAIVAIMFHQQPRRCNLRRHCMPLPMPFILAVPRAFARRA